MAIEKFIPLKEEKIPEGENPLDALTSGCEKKEPFVLMVLGDSMLPEFSEGEVIVIEPDLPAQNGSYVIAYHQDEYIFRQLIQRDGKWYLHALNNNYPTEEIDSLDSIKGVITQKKSPGGRKNRKNYR